MSLLQTSVIKKYVTGLDNAHVEKKYQVFNDYFGKLDIQQQIDQTDREIDQMVYDLYGLIDEEIKIVEESVG